MAPGPAVGNGEALVDLEPGRQGCSGCLSNTLSIYKSLEYGLLKSKPNHERETVQKKKKAATGQKRAALFKSVIPEGNLWSGLVAHENCFSGNDRKCLIKEEMKGTP